MKADGVGGLSWGGVIDFGIEGRQCFKTLNSRNGCNFQFACAHLQAVKCRVGWIPKEPHFVSRAVMVMRASHLLQQRW
jgi:hypothetical protein